MGVLTAIAASMCCIAPVFALLAGTSSLAVNFSWIEPYRQYFIGFSILFVGFAWYQKLKKKKVDDCNCEVVEKKTFFESTLFYILITLFTILSIAFPYYSENFY